MLAAKKKLQREEEMHLALEQALNELRKTTDGNFSIESEKGEIIETTTIRAGRRGEGQRRIRYCSATDDEALVDFWLDELVEALNKLLAERG